VAKWQPVAISILNVKIIMMSLLPECISSDKYYAEFQRNELQSALINVISGFKV